MRRLPSHTLLPVIAMLLAASGIAGAQDTAGPALSDTWVVTPKAGHDAEFVEAFKAHLKFRESKGDPRVWQAYAPIVGDQLGFYVIRFCCSDWSAMDEYQSWSASAGISEHWNNNVDPHIASYRHYLGEVDMKNSNWPAGASGYRYFGVTDFWPKPGHGRQLEAAKVELSDAAKAGNWSRHWSWGSSIGGKPNLNLVSPFKNYAAMADPDKSFFELLTEQLGSGKKATAALKRFSDATEGSSYTIYRLIDDMSMKER